MRSQFCWIFHSKGGNQGGNYFLQLGNCGCNTLSGVAIANAAMLTSNPVRQVSSLPKGTIEGSSASIHGGAYYM